MSKTEIVPCPWCGKQPQLETFGSVPKYYYSCNNLRCPVTPTTNAYRDKKSATRAWNKCKSTKTKFKIPVVCKDCRFCKSYNDGPWACNPHHLCELKYTLHEEDPKVEPNEFNENCPLSSLILVD